ncbi:hypothetical protein MRY82_10510 [bacterium]|nr:hypothetical protein [bacterium]
MYSSYSFLSFEINEICFWGNSLNNQEYDLENKIFSDTILYESLKKKGMIQIGSSKHSFYNPICFDLKNKNKNGDAQIIEIDHERILINDEVHITKKHFKSFEDLLVSTNPQNNL